MSNNFDLWTIFESYSLVQGFILSIYTFFYFRRPFLTFLLAAISTLLLAHLFYHFGWFFDTPHLIFVEAPIWYLIGPFFYFLTRKVFDINLERWSFLHLLPFLVFLIYLGPFYFESAQTKIDIFLNLYSEDTYKADINRYVFSAHIFLYLAYSLILFNKRSKLLKDSSAQSTLIFDSVASSVLRYYLIFSFISLLAYVIVANSYSWADHFYDLYYIGLSLLIHFIFFFLVFRSNSEDLASKAEENGEKYKSSSLSDSEMQEIVVKVRNYVDQMEVYKNPELRLGAVSDELQLPKHHISQALNQKLQISFFDLVNKCRIEGLKANINHPEYKNYTLIGIASEHGFKSPSSFYRIFKKFTGKTPKEYFKSLK